MRIAVNTRFLLADKLEGFGWYTFEIVKRLVENHPEHEFIFFFDRPYDPQFVFGKNVHPVILRPAARHPILFRWWFNVAVTKALKKYRADLFFSPDGYLSLRTKVPQVGVIHDINFAHFPNDLPKSAAKYLNHYFPLFARKAAKVITVSEYSRQDIIKTYGMAEEKVIAIWNSASDDFKPSGAAQQVKIRSELTGGKPYFLFIGSLHPRKNIRRLLEGYSTYRRQWPDGNDLVIVGEALWKKQQLPFAPELLASRGIHFTGRLDQQSLIQVCAAAHSLVYVPYFEGFGIPLVEAMKCGIPVIAGNLTALPEVLGDAGILLDPHDSDAIASAMQELTNNEALHLELSRKSLQRAGMFSWNKAAEAVWEVLEQELNQASENQ